MKKILCVLLAVMMIFSSVAVMGASAAGGYVTENPVTDSFSSYDEFAAENENKEIYGFTYDFLYESDGIVDWDKISIHNDVQGIPVPVSADRFEGIVDDMAYYAKRITINYFGGEKIFSEEYALAIINFLGKLLYPDFAEVTSASAFKNGTTPDEDTFYRGIVEDSRIWEVVDNAWIKTGIDYEDFLYAFGADLTHMTESDSHKPKAVAKALVKGMVSSFIAFGPIDFAYRLLDTFSTGYSATATLYESTTALFSMKIAACEDLRNAEGQISVNKLKSMEGLLSYAFDGITDYEFFDFPTERMASSQFAKCDKYLWLLMYFAINYRYQDNASVVDGMAAKLNRFLTNWDRYSRAGYSYDEAVAVSGNLSKIIDVIFKGDISDDTMTFINSLSSENISELPNDIFTQFKNWLANLMKKIADYFDYIVKLLSGDRIYGDTVLDW